MKPSSSFRFPQRHMRIWKSSEVIHNVTHKQTKIQPFEALSCQRYANQFPAMRSFSGHKVKSEEESQDCSSIYAKILIDVKRFLIEEKCFL